MQSGRTSKPKESRTKRLNEDLTVVSLFTGAGGLDIGLEMAGFKTVAAVENDADCIETLRSNQHRALAAAGRPGKTFLKSTRLIHADINEVNEAQLRPSGCRATWAPDVLAGGPPCQPFSSAGKQLSFDDPRGRLFENYVRLAQALKPRLLLFENVRGLVTAKGPSDVPGEALALVLRAFNEIGYATSCALMNAADYGCPQRRVRLFIVGARQEPLPSFPERTHEEPSVTPSLWSVDRKPWVTLGDFLALQPLPDISDVIRPSPALALALSRVVEGSGLKSPGARETTRPGGHWGYKQGTFIADRAKPARTVTAAATQDWVREKNGMLRRLTWRECAGLQGFPSEWVFCGSQASRYRQIGNAVPVLFGVVIGRSLIEALRVANPRRIPESAPLPADIVSAIEYTRREDWRNGESRRAVKHMQATGRGRVRELKGLGSAGFQLHP